MDRDLQDVLRELRMGTAQVGSPEQFFALVAPAAAAIRESLEAVPQATQELRAATNDLREKVAALQSASQDLAQRSKLVEDAARAIPGSGQQIVGQIARATESMQRSVAAAGDYPRWTLALIVALAVISIFWSRSELKEMRRRFDVLEHNQVVMAQKLGIPVVSATESAARPQPADETKGKVQRKRGLAKTPARPN